MKTKIKKLTVLFLILIIALSPVTTVYAGSDNRGKAYFSSILSYNTGSKSVQTWIDTTLSSQAGNGSEWYIIGLSQNEKTSGKKYNYSKFESSLIAYTKRATAINPSAKLRIALALASIGSTDKFISEAMNSAIGKQGIMSYIFGLHMLNNGYKSSSHTKSSVTNQIMSLQNSNGGWALFGTNSDVDVTAMAIQALAPQYSNAKVKAAINNALSYLSGVQADDASFMAQNGSDLISTCESTSQVIMALACLNIDCVNDSRFIKNSNNLFDALSRFKNSNAFSHTIGGAVNALSTQQAFYCLVSYNRMGNLYLLDKARPNDVQTDEVDETTTVSNNISDKNSNNSSNNISNNSSNTTNDNTIKGNSTTTESTSENASAIITNSEWQNDTQITESTNNQSEANTENISNNTAVSKENKISYKLIVSIAILILAIIICVVLHLTKKGNKDNYIIVICVSLIAILIVALTNFQSVNSHKNDVIEKSNAIGTVTISIKCDTIKDKGKSEYVPKDGVILSTTSVDIIEGDTPYDILNEVCTKNNIALESTGSSDSIYIEGINQIYELEYGDLSGWMYHINGEEPNVSSSAYSLNDGDNIEWLYTCDLGKDIK